MAEPRRSERDRVVFEEDESDKDADHYLMRLFDPRSDKDVSRVRDLLFGPSEVTSVSEEGQLAEFPLLKEYANDPGSKTGIVYDEWMLLHEGPAHHPENPWRVRSIWSRLCLKGLAQQCRRISAREATREELLLAHTAKHVNEVFNTSGRQIDKAKELEKLKAGETVGDGKSQAPADPEVSDHICHECNDPDNGHVMLLCEGCDIGVHTFCLNPPLERIPEGDWYCAECLKEEEEGAAAGDDAAERHTRKKAKKASFEVGFGDTYGCEHSAVAARLAAGGTIDLMQTILDGTCENGIAVVRPPGHHAERHKSMGFCVFNTVAVAAHVAKAKGCKRVLIVDWDAHHGNGTQHIFDSDPAVLYFSAHRYEDGNFYPGTGSMQDVGEGEGEGFNVNVPWANHGLGDPEYLACFERVLLPIARQYNPEIVIVSAGFDAAAGDPLGGMKVSSAGFAHMTALLQELAQGKMLLVLEGGYNLMSIANASEACTRVLLGQALPPVTKSPINQIAEDTIQEVLNVQSKYWNVRP